MSRSALSRFANNPSCTLQPPCAAACDGTAVEEWLLAAGAGASALGTRGAFDWGAAAACSSVSAHALAGAVACAAVTGGSVTGDALTGGVEAGRFALPVPGGGNILRAAGCPERGSGIRWENPAA